MLAFRPRLRSLVVSQFDSVTTGRTLQFLFEPLVDAFRVEDVRALERLYLLTGAAPVQANAARNFRLDILD